MRFSTCTHCHRQLSQDAETGPGWLTVWRDESGNTGCDGHANVFALHYPQSYADAVDEQTRRIRDGLAEVTS